MHNAAAFLRIKFAEGTSHDGRSLRATAPFPNVMPLRHQFMEFPQRAAQLQLSVLAAVLCLPLVGT